MNLCFVGVECQQSLLNLIFVDQFLDFFFDFQVISSLFSF